MLIAFFVNDMEREFAGYTTTVLAYEAHKRGHGVCYVTPADFADPIHHSMSTAASCPRRSSATARNSSRNCARLAARRASSTWTKSMC